ncbi:Asparagine synthase [Ensifer sp. YR511]|nr:Asparagine synthase [Ensifer sp. YR511]
MSGLVGDGALLLSTPFQSTLFVPPFSELNIFAWQMDGDTILFDTFARFSSFAARNEISLRIDKEQITQFLASDRMNTKQTVFSGLVEIEHGCSLTVLADDRGASLVEVNHLPDLLCERSLTPMSGSDAAEEIRALTLEAIQFKASHDTVGIATSGGFDSSLIALLYGRAFPEKALHLYHVYSSRVRGLNEIEYFNDVRQRLSSHVTWLDAETTRDVQLDFPNMAPGFRPHMVAGWYERNWKMYAAAKQDGVSVILNGDGGDQLMLCLDEMSLAREFHKEGTPLLRSVVNEAILKQSSVWQVTHNWLAGKSDDYMSKWIHFDADNIEKVKPFLKLKALFPRRIFRDADRYENLSVSRQHQVCTLNDAKYNSLAAALGVCERKPFLYWPLVRFCVLCPRQILLAGGRERGLFRSAFSDTLPRSIANRVGKSGDVDVVQLFDYATVKKRVLASHTLADYIELDAVSTIDPHNLTDEIAGFLMRCATVDAYLKTI